MLQQGTVIAERFEVLSMLGEGAFGEVYLTRQLQLDRKVAVKLLKADVADYDSVERFEREAKALSELHHPNISMFIAFGIWGPYRYTALEYATGESLASYVTTHGALKSSAVQQLAAKILEGLAHAHAHGIVHRDVKPGNIIVSEDLGTVKLIDFGLAHIFSKQRLTQEGLAVGSVQYMSPEQCLGQPIDARTDLYALGCIMYECLTGTPAFHADQAVSVMFQQINAKRILVAKGNDGIVEFVNRLLEKDPADRFPTADEALVQLRRLSTNDAVPPKPKLVEVGEDAHRARMPSVPVVIAALAASLLIGVPAALIMLQARTDSSPSQFGRHVYLDTLGMHGAQLDHVLTERFNRVKRAIGRIDRVDPSQREIAERGIETELEGLWNRSLREPDHGIFVAPLREELFLPWADRLRRADAAKACVMIPQNDSSFYMCAWKAVDILDMTADPMDFAWVNSRLAQYCADNGKKGDVHLCAATIVRAYDKVLCERLSRDKESIYHLLLDAATSCEKVGLTDDAGDLYRCAASICIDEPFEFDRRDAMGKYCQLLERSGRFEDAEELSLRAVEHTSKLPRADCEAVWLTRLQGLYIRRARWHQILRLMERIESLKGVNPKTQILSEFFGYEAAFNLKDYKRAQRLLKSTMALMQAERLDQYGSIRMVDLQEHAGTLVVLVSRQARLHDVTAPGTSHTR